MRIYALGLLATADDLFGDPREDASEMFKGLLALVTVIILVLAAAGFYLWRNRKNR